jgi:hypothetical protein
MQPLGNMAGVFKPKRVGSSTCPRPVQSQEGTVSTDADLYAMEADTRWSGAEKHVVDLMVSNSISFDEAEQALTEIWGN